MGGITACLPEAFQIFRKGSRLTVASAPQTTLHRLLAKTELGPLNIRPLPVGAVLSWPSRGAGETLRAASGWIPAPVPFGAGSGSRPPGLPLLGGSTAQCFLQDTSPETASPGTSEADFQQIPEGGCPAIPSA